MREIPETQKPTSKSHFISDLLKWIWYGLLFAKGKGGFIFGSGIIRTLIEALIIASLLFLSAADNVVISDYRLVVLAYLPCGFSAVIWAAVRLRRLDSTNSRNSFYLFKPTGLNLSFGLILGIMLVVDCLLISTLFYPIQNLDAPNLPSLLSSQQRNTTPGQTFLFFEWIIAGPFNFDNSTPLYLIITLRLVTFVVETCLLFVLIRFILGILALPVGWIKRITARKLLWQLTLSHFTVVLASLTTAILCVLLIVIPFFSPVVSGSVKPARQLPAYEASLIVNTFQAAQKGDNRTLSNNLETFVQFFNSNNLLAIFSNPFAGKLSSQAQNLIQQVKTNSFLPGFIAVIGARGQLIYSTNTPRFNEVMSANKADLQALLNRSNSGETSFDRLVVEKVQPDLLIAGAYPVEVAGQTQMSILVVEPPEIALTNSSRLLGVMIVAGVFLLVAILLASFFTLFVALVFGYMVSRRLVHNLEELSKAADALATGNLEQRVDLPLVQDEVGRLAVRFNYMAQRLQESQASLEQEKQVVEQALQAKRDLVANVSHELRTPVSTIRAHVDWLLATSENRTQIVTSSTDVNYGLAQTTLLKPTDNSDLNQYLTIIERETQRLSDMIEDLLDLSQLEARSTSIQLQAVQIGELAQEIKQSLALMAQRERKVTLTLDITPGLPPVLADRNRLSQILVNLVRNGINYTPAGGIVSIGAAMKNSQSIVIWVADTGIGISPADLELIFERFYRSDASRSRNTGGAGLGLSIVKTLVEAMGGSLEVESVENEGSKFSVILPI